MSLKRNIGELSVLEFMNDELDGDVSENEDPKSETHQTDKPVKKRSPTKKISHKKSLEKLKGKDPEFYKFLQEQDKELLNFEDSDSDDSSKVESGSENELEVNKDAADGSDLDEDSEDEKFHKLPAELEVASDDSDTELADKPVTKKSKRTLVTLNMVNKWSTAMREKSSQHALHDAIMSFKAAVNQAGGDADGSNFKVEGSIVFNAVVRMCMVDILPCAAAILKLPKPKESGKVQLPSHSPNWNRIKLEMRSYVTDVIRLLEEVAEPEVLNVALKHVHGLTHYYAAFPKLTKTLMKRLIVIWSTGEETSRILAFLSINKLVRLLQDKLLQVSLKQMYMAYVRNTKFTSPTSLPNINFMQRALVEMFAIDINMTYQYAFVYIRQLAIHLRNAITVKKKETCQAVYNWQYIHSLHLWARLLSTIYPSDTLEPLIYPLTQTIIGTIKLIPTARYYPLRFHCVKFLNLISKNTKVYIPTLPFILEVFEITDFNKKHSAASIKPINFACILKLSKPQLQDRNFKDGVIDQIYELFMEQLNIHAHSIGFPELVLPAIIQLKSFLKRCKVANHTKQMKQILDKIQENSRIITERRKSASFSLADMQAVDSWEEKSKQLGTPIGKYYSSWRKLRDQELQHAISCKEQLEDDAIPTIKKLPPKATAEEKREFDALFDSDSDESDDNARFLPKSERPTKKQKTDEGSDDSNREYSDFDDDELEKLAQSASEEESDSTASGDESDSTASGSTEGAGSHSGQGSDEEAPDKEDIVEDFTLSSDED